MRPRRIATESEGSSESPSFDRASPAAVRYGDSPKREATSDPPTYGRLRSNHSPRSSGFAMITRLRPSSDIASPYSSVRVRNAFAGSDIGHFPRSQGSKWPSWPSGPLAWSEPTRPRGPSSVLGPLVSGSSSPSGGSETHHAERPSFS